MFISTDLLYTPLSLAEYLGVSVPLVMRWIDEGLLRVTATLVGTDGEDFPLLNIDDVFEVAYDEGY